MLQTRIKNRLIRRGIVALVLLATLPGAPVAAGQTFDEAVAAYDRGDYATAVRGFLVHAEQGDAAVAWLCLDITTPIQSAGFRLARRRFDFSCIMAASGAYIFS